MAPRNDKKSPGLDTGQKERSNKNDPNSTENVAGAHNQAEEDMLQDAELSSHSPNDDLDEGETARLGEDKTDLV